RPRPLRTGSGSDRRRARKSRLWYNSCAFMLAWLLAAAGGLYQQPGVLLISLHRAIGGQTIHFLPENSFQMAVQLPDLNGFWTLRIDMVPECNRGEHIEAKKGWGTGYLVPLVMLLQGFG